MILYKVYNEQGVLVEVCVEEAAADFYSFLIGGYYQEEKI